MPTSKPTTDKIIDILVSEVGIDSADRIVSRLEAETQGNQSYMETLTRLRKAIDKYAEEHPPLPCSVCGRPYTEEVSSKVCYRATTHYWIAQEAKRKNEVLR